MKIEIILILIIILIFLIYFILKSIKKDSSEIFTNKSNSSFTNFDIIFKRKKNIILSLIHIALFKVIIHYTIYPEKVSYKWAIKIPLELDTILIVFLKEI